MTPDDLAVTVSALLAGLIGDAVAPGEVRVEPAPDGTAWRTSIVLRRVGADDRHRVGRELAARLGADPRIASVAVTGPGYVDVALAAGAARRVIDLVLDEPAGRWPSPVDLGPGAAPDGELASRVGPGAARYATARGTGRGALDEARLLRRTPDNPFFRVAHAHALAARLVRTSAAVDPNIPDQAETAVDDPREAPLLTALARTHALAAADAPDPARLVRSLEALALAAESWAVPPRPAGGARTAEAVRDVLAGGLARLGIAAPDRL